MCFIHPRIPFVARVSGCRGKRVMKSKVGRAGPGEGEALGVLLECNKVLKVKHTREASEADGPSKPGLTYINEASVPRTNLVCCRTRSMGQPQLLALSSACRRSGPVNLCSSTSSSRCVGFPFGFYSYLLLYRVQQTRKL